MRFRPLSGIRSRRPGQEAGAADAAQELQAADGDLELRIGGMTCAGCATTIRDGLLQLPGVASAGVSPVTRRAVLRPDGTMAQEELGMLAEAAIAGLGYHVVEKDEPPA